MGTGAAQYGYRKADMKLDIAEQPKFAAPANHRGEHHPFRDSHKLRRRLRGDLDTIVLHALRKEPHRRYGSVEQFAEDIRHHLEGLPVTVRRDSWRYRAGKFVARHKLGVAAAALVIFAVLGGVAATVREARIAAANQRRAEQRFDDVRKLANSLMFEIHDAIRDLPGSTSARKLLVTRALEYLDSLNQQSKGDVSLQKELAAAYERVGDVLGYPYAANLGDNEGALQSYRKALAIRQSFATTFQRDVPLHRDLVGTYFRIAQILESKGSFSEALAELGNAQQIAERLAVGSNDPVLIDSLAGTYYFTASLKIDTGDLAGAQANYQRSASVRDAGLQANPGNLSLRTHLAADYGGLAKCLELNHDLPLAIEMQSKATAILEDVAKSNPQNAALSEYLGEGINRLASYRKEHGNASAALEEYRKANRIFSDLLAADTKNSLARSNVAFSNNGIAASLLALGKPADAERVFQDSIAAFEEMSARSISTRYPRSGLADAYSGLGAALLAVAADRNLPLSRKREDLEQARSACQKSLALWDDKEKRGELENAERASRSAVTECVAEGERQLAALKASGSVR